VAHLERGAKSSSAACFWIASVIFGRQWPALTHHRPAVPSRIWRPSSTCNACRAATSMRGACLNCRFDVNGIQNALRSLGVTFSLSDMTKLSFLPRFRYGQRLVFGAFSCYAIFDRLDKR
jgi:hypothetical protein